MTSDGLEKICKALKGTTTDIKWGADLCYLVGKKMYCVTSLEGSVRASFKVTPEDFGELTEREGIIPAPYMAKNFWVMVEKPSALTAKEWKSYVAGSYSMVLEKLPKKLQESILKSKS